MTANAFQKQLSPSQEPGRISSTARARRGRLAGAAGNGSLFAIVASAPYFRPLGCAELGPAVLTPGRELTAMEFGSAAIGAELPHANGRHSGSHARRNFFFSVFIRSRNGKGTSRLESLHRHLERHVELATRSGPSCRLVSCGAAWNLIGSRRAPLEPPTQLVSRFVSWLRERLLNVLLRARNSLSFARRPKRLAILGLAAKPSGSAWRPLYCF
jgi:hypothetical protein